MDREENRRPDPRRTSLRPRAAMSPVIGVTILVVIMMALTLLILFLVEFTGSDDEGPPELVFEFNETGEYAEVEQHSFGVTWDEFQVNMGEPGRFALVGGQVHELDDALVFVPVNESRPVEEGDRIHFCRSDEQGPVEVTVRHEASGQVMDQGLFSQVAQCPDDPRGGEGDNVQPGS